MNTSPREELLFKAAAPLPTGQRAAFLDRECADDPTLCARLEALLAAHDQPDTLAVTGAQAPQPHPILTPPPLDSDDAAGRILGRYKLLERLGEGGCGIVYVAEQTEPVRRRVALKLIKPGMDSKAVIARFEAERQALAMMDHPNIARVLDAGTADSGRPYFVMELVRGIRITEYCDQEKLSVHDRLDLFIKVCRAIQHAHQKGIIHRDIKPSNILVTLHDGTPVPKVIDFGIAKATEGRLTDATVYTQLYQFLGTPAYMSPEQAEMSGLDIDTRSDIYSLGVLLYELLTGVAPFDAKALMSQGVDAMRRTIREEEPLRPSTRLTQLQGARAGNPSPSSHAQVASDLDWIVMKCLEKDRGRRYETANGLAADIRRHLGNEPVVARPPSTAYRFQKAWRRNRLAFLAGGAVATVLLIGITLTTWQAIRAGRAEKAERLQTGLALADRDRATRAESQARSDALLARQVAYVAEINVAFQAIQANALERARELLDRQRPPPGEEDLRGFEWRHLWQLCRGEELATFRNVPSEAVAYSPDGRFLVHGNQSVVIRNARSREIVATLPTPATALGFSKAGEILATATPSGVKLWDCSIWQWTRTLPDAREPIAFSPDGRWLLTGIADGNRLWDTTSWQARVDLPGAPTLPCLN